MSILQLFEKSQSSNNKSIINAKDFFEVYNQTLDQWYAYLINHMNWAQFSTVNYQIWDQAINHELFEVKIELAEVILQKNLLAQLQKISAHSHEQLFEKLSDSKVYKEERDDTLHQFIFFLNMKLKINVDRFFTIETCLIYVFSRLIENTTAQLLFHLTATYDKIDMIKVLIMHLKQVYNDSNKQEMTQHYIFILKMKNCIFVKYLINFQLSTS